MLTILSIFLNSVIFGVDEELDDRMKNHEFLLSTLGWTMIFEILIMGVKLLFRRKKK